MKARVSLNNQVRDPFSLAKMGLDWAIRGRGPLTVGAGQVGGGARTEHAPTGAPDIQFNVMPLSVDKPGDPCTDIPASPPRYGSVIRNPVAGLTLSRTILPPIR